MSPIVATVEPEVLKWARKRTGLGLVDLSKFLKLKDISSIYEWEEKGEVNLSILEKIAKKAFIPIGYLFLKTPPDESLPITDFRKVTLSTERKSVSPELLDTIYYCQFRQDWFEKKAKEYSQDQLNFVGSVKLSTNTTKVAESIRKEIGVTSKAFCKCNDWEESLRVFVSKVESRGILVMRSGIAGTNTRRKLKVNEFRGFTLSSRYSPVIFINSNDSKSAQMFTLAHELTHIWLGQSGVSNIQFKENSEIEAFCNQVASEILIPNEEFVEEWNSENDPLDEARRVARIYRVSSLVTLIKAYQNKYITYQKFNNIYADEKRRFQPTKSKRSGGDFYRTQGVRLSKTFVSTVISDTHEGNTTYTEAFQLLGIRNSKTFNKMSSLIFNLA